MPITEKQREWRRNHLGSSDSPALFGLHPFKNLGDLYLEKTQPDLAEQVVGEAAEIGNMLEPSLVDWCAEKLGVRRVGVALMEGLWVLTYFAGEWYN